MLKLKRVVALALLVGISPIVVAAAVPQLLNYQGALSNASGVPLPDGNYSVTFRIWDVETGGTAVWTEGRMITVEKGLFNVLLGAVVPIPDSAFDSADRWLGMQVGLDDEIAPRTRLVSLPYAWSARNSDRADTATHSLDRTTDAGELVSGALDTLRFSAYDDLLSENRVGLGAGKLAEGDHQHGSVSGVMARFEDAGESNYTLLTSPIVCKSITIPGGTLGNYFRIEAMAEQLPPIPPGSSVKWEIQINGQTAGSFADQGLGTVSRRWITYVKAGGSNRWVGFEPGAAIQSWEVTLDASLAIEVSVVAIRETGSAPVDGNVYELLLEYDAD